MLEGNPIAPYSVDNADSRLPLAAEGGLAAASGLMLGLAFRIPSIALLAWVALVPLMVALHRIPPRRAALWGLVTGVIFFGVLLYWVAIFGVMATVGLIGYMSAWLVLFGVGAAWLSGSSLGWRLAGIPALFALIEYARSFGPYGFSWGVIGYSQQPVAAVSQVVSLAGVFGLSFAIALVGECLAEIALAKKSEMRTVVLCGGIAVATIVVVLGWGLYRASVPVRAAEMRIAGVQPSVDQWAKFDRSQADTVTATLTSLSEEALRDRPEMLIWPETVVPFTGMSDESFVKVAQRRAVRAGADFIFGAFVREDDGGVSNSVLLTTPAGRTSRYGKVHLVPFGEFVPARPLIGNVGMLRLVQVDQVSAASPVLLSSSRGLIGTVICFESSDEALVRRVVNMGSQLLVVVTNDGWFERTAASDQHFRITAMRAIENGIYVAQVSNNGISGIIDPRGRVLTHTGLWEETVMRGSVGLGAEPTPYRAAGSWPVVLVAIASVAGAASSRLRTSPRAARPSAWS